MKENQEVKIKAGQRITVSAEAGAAVSGESQVNAKAAKTKSESSSNAKKPKANASGSGSAEKTAAANQGSGKTKATAALKSASAATAKSTTANSAQSEKITKTVKNGVNVVPMECGYEKSRQAVPETQKKVAVVVGASSGIGYYVALELCKNGYTVYNLSRTESEPAVIHTVKADATKKDELFKAVSAVCEIEKRLDVFVYAAGQSLAAPIECITDDDFRNILEVNYFGLVKSLKAVVPVMRRQREGRIITISSMAGSTPIPFDAPYSASKAAMDITMRTLAIELKPYNIKVTSVTPGGVHTRFTFKRKVYADCEVGEYRDAMSRAVDILADKEQSGMDPKAVAESIVYLLDLKKPPEVTAVGLKNKSVRLMQKLLPQAFTDFVNRISFDQ